MKWRVRTRTQLSGLGWVGAALFVGAAVYVTILARQLDSIFPAIIPAAIGLAMLLVGRVQVADVSDDTEGSYDTLTKFRVLERDDRSPRPPVEW